MEFKKYQRRGSTFLRPYVPGESTLGITITFEQSATGSPKEGDMIARNPDNHADLWLIQKEYFEKHYTASLFA